MHLKEAFAQMRYVTKFLYTIVFPGLKWPPFFANYSLMVILIEKIIREMNLDIYRVIEFIFPHKYEFLYRLGLDGILVRFCCSSLN